MIVQRRFSTRIRTVSTVAWENNHPWWAGAIAGFGTGAAVFGFLVLFLGVSAVGAALQTVWVGIGIFIYYAWVARARARRQESSPADDSALTPERGPEPDDRTHHEG
jgi:hypothetical protein